MKVFVVMSKKDGQFTSIENVYKDEEIAKKVVKQLNNCSEIAGLGFEYLYYYRELC